MLQNYIQNCNQGEGRSNYIRLFVIPAPDFSLHYLRRIASHKCDVSFIEPNDIKGILDTHGSFIKWSIKINSNQTTSTSIPELLESSSRKLTKAQRVKQTYDLLAFRSSIIIVNFFVIGDKSQQVWIMIRYYTGYCSYMFSIIRTYTGKREHYCTQLFGRPDIGVTP